MPLPPAAATALAANSALAAASNRLMFGAVPFIIWNRPVADDVGFLLDGSSSLSYLATAIIASGSRPYRFAADAIIPAFSIWFGVKPFACTPRLYGASPVRRVEPEGVVRGGRPHAGLDNCASVTSRSR